MTDILTREIGQTPAILGSETKIQGALATRRGPLANQGSHSTQSLGSGILGSGLE